MTKDEAITWLTQLSAGIEWELDMNYAVAIDLAIEALKAQEAKPMKLSTVCLLCKKPAVTFSTDDDITYG